MNLCEERVWQQPQHGARECSQVLWLAPDFLIHLKISHSQVLWLAPDFLIHLKISHIHHKNCTGAPWCKIGPYDKWWFWPMDCCYVAWADGAWLRGYIRDCDWGRSKEIPREIDFWREIPACMLKGSWINCFEKNAMCRSSFLLVGIGGNNWE